MAKTPNVTPEQTDSDKLNFILKFLSKVAELLEEQVDQQAEILDQLKNRDLIGEDYSITRPGFEEV